MKTIHFDNTDLYEKVRKLTQVNGNKFSPYFYTDADDLYNSLNDDGKEYFAYTVAYRAIQRGLFDEFKWAMDKNTITSNKMDYTFGDTVGGEYDLARSLGFAEGNMQEGQLEKFLDILKTKKFFSIPEALKAYGVNPYSDHNQPFLDMAKELLKRHIETHEPIDVGGVIKVSLS